MGALLPDWKPHMGDRMDNMETSHSMEASRALSINSAKGFLDILMTPESFSFILLGETE